MSADSAVTYTSVHFEARSWSIPSEDPYEEAARQFFEQAPHSPEHIPDPMELEDHVPVYIPEPEHPEDLVPAEEEAPTPPLPPFFLSPRTPPLLPIPLHAPSTSRRADIPEAYTPPRKRLLLTTPRPGCEIGESSAAAARQPGPTIETRLRDTERRMMTVLELVNRRVTYQVDVCTRESLEFCTRHHDAQKDRAAVRAEVEVLRRERLAYEQEGMETRQALARSEAHYRALEARVNSRKAVNATTEYQEAIQATEDIESPAVGFAKTSDYKGGLTNQVNATIKQNNTLLYLASKQSQKLIELEEKFDRLKQKVHTIIKKEIQPADLEDSISSLAKKLDNFSISGKIPVKRIDGNIRVFKDPNKIFKEQFEKEPKK
ncbi:hypothetical protein Tco_1563575 [Tanacetum coccineum]